MMISHRLRCIFAHAPKCAGTSIKRTLDLDFIVPPYWHCTWAEAEMMVGTEVLRTYFKFAVVRNPWDRVISAWRMFLEKPWCRQENDYTLLEFLRVVTDESIPYRARYLDTEEQQRWQKTRENIRHHTLPCLHPYYGLVDESGELAMDQVIQFENIQAGFHGVIGRLGLGTTELPRENVTKHEHYSSYYCQESRDIVAAFYESDILRFGYRFESPPDGGQGNTMSAGRRQ